MSDNNIQVRLRRVEGQIRGLQRMVDAGTPCEQTLTQLLAARSALDQVGLIIVNNYVERCLLPDDDAEMRDRIQKIFNLILTRYSLSAVPGEMPLSSP